MQKFVPPNRARTNNVSTEDGKLRTNKSYSGTGKEKNSVDKFSGATTVRKHFRNRLR